MSAQWDVCGLRMLVAIGAVRDRSAIRRRKWSRLEGDRIIERLGTGQLPNQSFVACGFWSDSAEWRPSQWLVAKAQTTPELSRPMRS